MNHDDDDIDPIEQWVDATKQMMNPGFPDVFEFNIEDEKIKSFGAAVIANFRAELTKRGVWPDEGTNAADRVAIGYFLVQMGVGFVAGACKEGLMDKEQEAKTVSGLIDMHLEALYSEQFDALDAAEIAAEEGAVVLAPKVSKGHMPS